jgi:hypothetical protein
MDARVWRQSENWVGTRIEDVFAMISLDQGQYVSLNATATEVWEAIETPATIDHIAEKLIARYEVSAEHCQSSVTNLLARLEDLGLVSSS